MTRGSTSQLATKNCENLMEARGNKWRREEVCWRPSYSKDTTWLWHIHHKDETVAIWLLNGFQTTWDGNLGGQEVLAKNSSRLQRELCGLVGDCWQTDHLQCPTSTWLDWVLSKLLVLQKSFFQAQFFYDGCFGSEFFLAVSLHLSVGCHFICF